MKKTRKRVQQKRLRVLRCDVVVLMVSLFVLFLSGLTVYAFASARDFRAEHQARFDEAVEAIEDGQYILGYSILEQMEDDWGDVRETRLGIRDKYLAQLADGYLEVGDEKNLEDVSAVIAEMEGEQQQEYLNRVNYQKGLLCYEEGRYLDALGYLLPLRDWRFEQELVYECIVGAKKELAELWVS